MREDYWDFSVSSSLPNTPQYGYVHGAGTEKFVGVMIAPPISAGTGQCWEVSTVPAPNNGNQWTDTRIYAENNSMVPVTLDDDGGHNLFSKVRVWTQYTTGNPFDYYYRTYLYVAAYSTTYNTHDFSVRTNLIGTDYASCNNGSPLLKNINGAKEYINAN